MVMFLNDFNYTDIFNHLVTGDCSQDETVELQTQLIIFPRFALH